MDKQISKRSFTRAGLFLFLLIGLGKIIAFLKDVVISTYFGIDYKTDAYFVANQIPSLIFVSLFATVTLVFLPLYNTILKEKGPDVSGRFASNALIHYAIIAFLLSGCGVWFAEEIVRFVAPSFNDETIKLAVSFTRILCLSFVFSMMTGVLSAIQYVHKLLLGPQLVPVICNLTVIIGTIIFYNDWGLYAVAVSAVIGWIIQVPVQRILLGSVFSFKWHVNIKDENLRKMGILIVPAFIGTSIDQVNVIIDNTIGSGLPEGSVSALNYAMRLMNFCSGFFLVFITAIVYPLFSDYVIKGDIKSLNALLSKSIRGFVLVALPIILVSSMFSKTIISVVFMRGAFDSQAVGITSIVFVGYIVGLLFIFFRELLNRVFYAYQSTVIPMLISGIAIIVNYLLSVYLTRHMGVFGLALATSASILVYTTLQFLILTRRIGTGFYSDLFPFLCKVLVSAIVMYVFQYSYFLLIPDDAMLIYLVGAITSGVIVYIVVLSLLKVEEMSDLRRALQKHLEYFTKLKI